MRVLSTLLVVLFSMSLFAQQPNSLQSLRSNESTSLHFETLPSAVEISNLANQGIHLTDYIGNNTYQATIAKRTDISKVTSNLGISKTNQKRAFAGIVQDIQADNIPAHARVNKSDVEVAITFNTQLTEENINNIVAEYDGKLLKLFPGGELIVVRIASKLVAKILNESFVKNIEFRQDAVTLLNYENKSIQGAHFVHKSTIPGMELDGSGIVVGVGDGGQMGNHIDFDHKKLSETTEYAQNFGVHGDHVTGTIGSRGNLDPKQSGFAPESNLIIEKTDNIIFRSREYYDNYSMVLTNNSYGSSANCETNGSYNYTSYTLDKQLCEMPNLMHVFAAGNFGVATCDGFPQGYKTVLKYYGSAKNVLTVGSVDENLKLVDSSSRGPAKDGRIKPEICGVGKNVYSNGRDNDYLAMSGTSMAAPSVTGSLALMYQKYEQDNGEVARGDLMKAIICNTADDMGPAGPDYKYGFGLVNLYRAVKTIEDERFLLDAVENNQKANHIITIPAQVKEAKFLLYWNDKEVTSNPEIALVNNLDIEIISPNGEVILPWVLNHNSADVNAPATRKIDALNNIEQITINNPIPGDYKVVVKGKEVPFGPQAFALTYEMIKEEVLLTFPVGEESLVPDERYSISWMSNMSNENSFKLELSVDDGSTWNLIVDNIPAAHRTYKWRTPEAITHNAKIRISMNNTALSNSNDVPFHILGKPEALSSIAVCSETIRLVWEDRDFADKYIVYMLKDGRMEVIGETSQKYMDIEYAYEANKDYWFSVANKMNLGHVGERANAISARANFAEACNRDIDGKLSTTRKMMNGRAYTNTSLDEKTSIGVSVYNNGNKEFSGYNMSVRINNGGVVSEECTEILQSGEEKEYEFSNKFDFTEVGTYAIDTWMSHPMDNLHYNDSILGQVKVTQLPNAPVSLPLVFDFKNVEEFYYHETQIGLSNLTHFDFIKGSNLAESSLEATSNFEYLGLTNHEEQGDQASAYVMTVNLSNFDMSDDIMLTFDSKVYSADIGKPAEVWLRGSDMDTWIKVMNMNNSSDWESSENISIREHLLANSQVLSTSTQVKFTLESKGNVSIDNIALNLFDLNPIKEKEIQSTVSIYPNVTQNDFTLAIDNENDTNISITIVSSNGQIVRKMEENLDVGENIFTYQAGNNLAPGMYFLTIDFGSHTEVKKITKVSQ